MSGKITKIKNRYSDSELDDIQRIVNELENIVRSIPDFEDEMVNLNEKIDLNNEILNQILENIKDKKVNDDSST